LRFRQSGGMKKLSTAAFIGQVLSGAFASGFRLALM
jgi:hypothetical protein